LRRRKITDLIRTYRRWSGRGHSVCQRRLQGRPLHRQQRSYQYPITLPSDTRPFLERALSNVVPHTRHPRLKNADHQIARAFTRCGDYRDGEFMRLVCPLRGLRMSSLMVCWINRPRCRSSSRVIYILYVMLAFCVDLF
jgi:hypothetical protein